MRLRATRLSAIGGASRRLGSVPIPILDQLGVASAASFSLRRTRSAYTGSAIRVRRSSDNVEADIGFTANGDLDTASLMAHVDVDNGRIWDAGTLIATGSFSFGGLVELANKDILVTEFNNNRVYRSTDGGATYSLLSTIGNSAGLCHITQLNNGEIWAAGTSTGSFYRSTDGGTSWSSISFGTSIREIRQLANGDLATLGFSDRRFYRSQDGITWSSEQIATTGNFFSLTELANGDILATGNGRVYKRSASSGTWNAGVTLPGAFAAYGITTLSNGDVLVTAQDGRVYRSTNSGATWSLTAMMPGLSFDVREVSNKNVLLLGASTFRVYRSASNGFVVTRYDQSGNGRNATQTTAASQPRIVRNGVIETKNGKPTINQFSGYGFVASVPITGSTVTASVVASLDLQGGSAYKGLMSISSAGQFDYDSDSRGCLLVQDNNFARVSGFRNASNSAVDITIGTQFVATSVYDGTNHTMWKDGIAGPTVASTGDFSTTQLSIGERLGGSSPWVGTLSEEILFLSALSTTDRQTLERNQGAYYNVNVA